MRKMPKILRNCKTVQDWFAHPDHNLTKLPNDGETPDTTTNHGAQTRSSRVVLFLFMGWLRLVYVAESLLSYIFNTTELLNSPHGL